MGNVSPVTKKLVARRVCDIRSQVLSMAFFGPALWDCDIDRTHQRYESSHYKVHEERQKNLYLSLNKNTEDAFLTPSQIYITSYLGKMSEHRPPRFRQLACCSCGKDLVQWVYLI